LSCSCRRGERGDPQILGSRRVGSHLKQADCVNSGYLASAKAATAWRTIRSSPESRHRRNSAVQVDGIRSSGSCAIVSSNRRRRSTEVFSECSARAISSCTSFSLPKATTCRATVPAAPRRRCLRLTNCGVTRSFVPPISGRDFDDVNRPRPVAGSALDNSGMTSSALQVAFGHLVECDQRSTLHDGAGIGQSARGRFGSVYLDQGVDEGVFEPAVRRRRCAATRGERGTASVLPRRPRGRRRLTTHRPSPRLMPALMRSGKALLSRCSQPREWRPGSGRDPPGRPSPTESLGAPPSRRCASAPTGR